MQKKYKMIIKSICLMVQKVKTRTKQEESHLSPCPLSSSVLLIIY